MARSIFIHYELYVKCGAIGREAIHDTAHHRQPKRQKRLKKGDFD